MIRKSIVVFFVCITGIQAAGQGLLDSVYTREQLKSDLASLHETLLASHPDPFAFCSEKKFEDVYLASQFALDENTSWRDFSLIVANLLNVLQDSHTSLDYGQLQSLQLEGKGYYLPLSLERVEAVGTKEGFELIVRSDWEDKIPKGSKLISINGFDINELYKKALIYSCVEGNATDAQNSVAAAILPSITGLLHPYAKKNTLIVIPPDSMRMHEMIMRGYNQKEFLKKRLEREKKTENKSVKVDWYEENSLAVLKVSTFSPGRSRVYKNDIRLGMQEIIRKGYKNVAIDIRNNGGGSSAWVEYLYSFIDTSGYNTPSNVIAKNSNIAMQRAKFFHTGLGQILSFVFYRNNEDVQSFRTFSKLKFGEMDTIFFHHPTKQEKSLVYEGNCFLMINGLTASAGVDFTNAFKSKNRGKIIGEQCLGPQTGTFGNPAWYVLPNCKMRISIATIRYNYDNTFQYDPNGILPDIVVDCVPGDIKNDVDTQLEFIKKLIQEKR